MADQVNIALLLKPEWRAPEGIARVGQAAATLGIEITGAGRATVSAKVSLELCQSLFGATAVHRPPRAGGQADFGAPGGYDTADQLEVPEALRDLVESIAIVPPARRLG